jgi:hypothetical protein
LHLGSAAVLGATLITVIIVLSRPERFNYLRGHPQLAILGILVVASVIGALAIELKQSLGH